MERVGVILLAAGQASRFGTDKLWATLQGKPVVAHSMSAIASLNPAFVVVVAPQPRWAELQLLANEVDIPDLRLTGGGDTRQESVRCGLGLCEDADYIIVHDGARPLAQAELFRSALQAAHDAGAATCVVPVSDSIKKIAHGQVVSLERQELFAVQTPQAFRAAALRIAHERAIVEGWTADDDCALVERCALPVAVVEGDQRNLKLTTATDLAVADALLSSVTEARRFQALQGPPSSKADL